MSRFLVIALLALTTACASASSGASAARTARDRDVLTSEEIMTSAGGGVEDVYEALRRLRPHFLQGRGTSSMQSTGVAVYFENTPAGSVEVLKGLRIEHIREVRFLNSSAATLRFGTGHTDGAVVVTLRK